MGSHQLPAAYRHLISLFDERDTRGFFTDEFQNHFAGRRLLDSEPESSAGQTPILNRILDLQFSHWLPDDILTKQDKLSMAHAVEGRVPYLDHELVEYALKLPPYLKIRGGKSKYILRRYADQILPKRITARRKMPFYAPIERSYADPAFQELLHDTLSERALRGRGIFRPDAVSRLRGAMRRGEFIVVKQIFSLMALELWFRMAVDRRGTL